MDPAWAVWQRARDRLTLGLWLPLAPGDEFIRHGRAAGPSHIAAPHLKEFAAVFASVPWFQTAVDSMLRAWVDELDETADQTSHCASSLHGLAPLHDVDDLPCRLHRTKSFIRAWPQRGFDRAGS